jgi:hypothetical protein
MFTNFKFLLMKRDDRTECDVLSGVNLPFRRADEQGIRAAVSNLRARRRGEETLCKAVDTKVRANFHLAH